MSRRTGTNQNSSGHHRGPAAVLACALAVGAIAAGFLALRPTVDADIAPAEASTGANGGTAQPPPLAAPETGPSLSATTPEGSQYALAAASTGVSTRPLPEVTPAPDGLTHAYADYVLTNESGRPVLLEFPADLFVPRAAVAAAQRSRCMPQPGVPADLCTIPTRSELIGLLGRSGPPELRDGDRLMPGGSSYLIRVTSELAVKADLAPEDIGLYVYTARFNSTLKGIELSFP